MSTPVMTLNMNATLSPAPKLRYYTPEQLATLDKSQVPHHVAIIPDGNRRWARSRHSSVNEGHREGADTIMDTVRAAKELGIKVLTIYVFSTENWTRPQMEVNGLFWLIETYLLDKKETMKEEGVKLQTIGQIEKLPRSLQEAVRHVQTETADNSTIELVLALNYGGRDDVCRAVKHLAEQCQQGVLNPEQIDEALICRTLDTHHWQDPDLLIRTSGELRVSNFLLWQISYSEIYVSDSLWPNFNAAELLQAVLSFQKRQRRLGGE